MKVTSEEKIMSAKKLTFYVLGILLLLFIVFGNFAIYYALASITYSSLRIWFMRLKPYEPRAGLMAYYALALGTAIGIPLYVVLLVMSVTPNCRRLKRTLQRWRGYDRRYEIV
jgi:hypothetical protein